MALSLYILSLVLLFIFALHRFELIRLYLDQKNLPLFPVPISNTPKVTIQLPVYNEALVIERLLLSAAAIDYPKVKLEIQLLDDSTDETSAIASSLIAKMQAEGIPIFHIRRKTREGYKAGALQYGLERASGEFIAIFDADFILPPDFLRSLLPSFTTSKIGMVQARWGFLNEKDSSLTRVQAMMLDGHFDMEHTARFRHRLLFNFNGTAGIWRKEAIVSSGGWRSESLAEDLDLSYRAQLAGWKFVYRHDVLVPAELPTDWGSFKSQQYRWAKGSAQTCKRLLPMILRSNLSVRQKVEAFFHLTAVNTYIFGLLLALSAPFAFSIDSKLGSPVIDLLLFLFFFSAIAGFFMIPQRERGKSWGRSLSTLIQLMGVGIGLSLNNSLAILDGWIGRTTPFIRTPKRGNLLASHSRRWLSYRPKMGVLRWGELLLTIYFFVSLNLSLATGRTQALWVLTIFSLAYLYSTLSTFLERLPRTQTDPNEKWEIDHAKSPLRLFPNPFG